jgi:hypothetical protein
MNLTQPKAHAMRHLSILPRRTRPDNDYCGRRLLVGNWEARPNAVRRRCLISKLTGSRGHPFSPGEQRWSESSVQGLPDSVPPLYRSCSCNLSSENRHHSEMNVHLGSRALYGSGTSKANELYCGWICLNGTRYTMS